MSVFAGAVIDGLVPTLKVFSNSLVGRAIIGEDSRGRVNAFDYRIM